ncbi:MAG TPA: hypothetical protein VFA04_15325 [Bryobacteraceae bacterium]|jgi:hypothetical protein|nr:hypothetical protein [Bryobacteraceae bacterium]
MLRRVAVLGSVIAAAAMFADTLTLRNGTTVQGTYAGGDTRTVRMLVGDRVQSFHVGQVTNLVFGDTGDQGANYNAPPPPDNSGLQTQRAYEQPNPGATGVTIPAGTPIVVRMIDRVDSEVDRTGQTFRASVDEPVMVNGQTIIPRGSDAVVKLVAAQQSGKFAGRTALTMALQQVSVNGRMVDTYTESVTQASSSRGSRTAKTVGGGAALGAIIGGLAGGGRGAAIGAGAGGAVGAGAEAVTAGQRVKVPAETRLTFTLNSAVQL